jgi:uncharacterized protein (DUF1015 family)
MPKTSRETAEVEHHGPVTDRHAELDGYTVNIVTFDQDIDATPLLKGLPDDRRQALRGAIEQQFDVSEVSGDELEPPADGGPVAFGYLDAFHKRPLRLTLKDQSIADAALDGRSDAYRRLDTAVLEALILKGALGMSEDDVANKRGLGYSKDFADARDAVESGRYEAAFFMRGTPVEQVQDVAAAGESMPPKSTYFFPKIPTGLVFNPLE